MSKTYNPEMVERAVKLVPSYWRLVFVAVDTYLASEPADLSRLDRERLEIAAQKFGAAGHTRQNDRAV